MRGVGMRIFWKAVLKSVYQVLANRNKRPGISQ
jgi:hypothetical protein